MSTNKIFSNIRTIQSAASALLAGAAFFAATAIVSTAPVKAEDLVVKYDQSQLLRLPRAVSEVIIGNPIIADVNVETSKLLVITGKTFGITNLIALDSEKQVITNVRVVVVRPSAKTVNLMRGSDRESYNCTPECNPSLVIGDEAKYFNKVAKSAQVKTNIAEGAATASGAGGQQ